MEELNILDTHSLFCEKLHEEMDTNIKFVWWIWSDSKLSTGSRGKQLTWLCPKVTKYTYQHLLTCNILLNLSNT